MYMLDNRRKRISGLTDNEDYDDSNDNAENNHHLSIKHCTNWILNSRTELVISHNSWTNNFQNLMQYSLTTQENVQTVESTSVLILIHHCHANYVI